MHTKPMRDSDGKFSEWKMCYSTKCNCGSEDVQCRLWESNCGGYTDSEYKCNKCKRIWWIDGSDS